jgi:hypothetical protein
MDRTTRFRSTIITTAIACTAIMVPAVALAASSAPAGPAASASAAKAASVPRCKGSNIDAWLGLNDDGAGTGTISYPLEFTNNGVGTHTCYLKGSPALYAVNGKGQRIGPVLHGTTSGGKITLKPGQTSYSVIGIAETSFIAGCKASGAVGLVVTPPGLSGQQEIGNFTLTACKNKQYLRATDVVAGVGIP